MGDISAKSLSKEFQVHSREAGTMSAVKSLFRRKKETVRAVDNLSFEIRAGERVGFLGPNGAGKTTTLKMLAGLLHPTAGEITVCGHSPKQRSPRYLEQITLVMGQKQQLLWDLPPAETFALNRAIYQIPDSIYRESLAELTELLEIEKIRTKPTRQLSLGERMKCELAAALLHRPRVLFLDEPTIGLDVTMQVTVREFVRTYNQRHGATVILTSHYMADVLALCPRVIVIDKGKLLYDGDLRALSRRMSPDKRVSLKFGSQVARADLERFGIISEQSDKQSFDLATLTVSADELTAAIAGILATLQVIDLTVEDPPLEETMQKLFRTGLEPAEALGSAEPRQ